MTAHTAEQIYDALKQHYNVLLYGPPGTGKTYLMQEVMGIFLEREGGGVGEVVEVDTASERQPLVSRRTQRVKAQWVTFHQTYSYEEFIVGLRPDPDSDKLVSLKPVTGVLLELSEFARAQDHAALLVIDEINRGNVSRIFGEFITLLEPDKRLDQSGQPRATTIAIRLPYLPTTAPPQASGTPSSVPPNPFSMPLRVYTLASMNSVDKSVAPLDAALRRRFHTIVLEPDLDLIATLMSVSPPTEASVELPDPVTEIEHVRTLALALLRTLNVGIATYIGPEYQLGHWYLSDLLKPLASVDAAKGRLVMLWESRLLPQVEELFHGRSEQLESILGLGEANVGDPIFLERPHEEALELGAAPFLSRRTASVDQSLAFLRRLAGVRPLAPTTPSQN